MANNKVNSLTNKYLDNCLNTIRLIAAISVMYGHVCTHLNINMPKVINRIMTYFPGVPIFFAISGFLVWYSAKKGQSYSQYLKKRFWRIYPELWCAVIIEIITLICMLHGEVNWGLLTVFSITQSTVLQFWTPDFLRVYGCETPNGSLWTICVIVQFYIIIYPMAKIMKKARIKHWILLILSSILVAVASPFVEMILPELLFKLYSQTLIPYLWLFVIGAFVCEEKERILPFLKKTWFVFLLISAVIMFIKIDITALRYPIFRCLTIILGLIGFSYAFPKLNIHTDISYGIYLYHMTVVNVIIMLGYSEKWVLLLIVCVISCILSYISTMTIGKWAQNKKNEIALAK